MKVEKDKFDAVLGKLLKQEPIKRKDATAKNLQRRKPRKSSQRAFGKGEA